MPLKVLGLMGSPRFGGNTDLLLDEALRGARDAGAEVEKVNVARLKISPCQEIYACLKDGNCPLRDDMANLYDRLLNTDAIIVASPIFFYTISPQLMALISRSQALWSRRYILHMEIPAKKGAFIAVGATRGEKLFDGSKLTIRYFFKAINADYTAELFVRGVDKKGEIKGHPTALADAYTLGKKLAGQPSSPAAQ
ncbi:MAG: flavodoxin family protein [Dehalococcoidales bacterium]|nr:flavodoxin family protein [Dehalococcoidales bacterium]